MGAEPPCEERFRGDCRRATSCDRDPVPRLLVGGDWGMLRNGLVIGWQGFVPVCWSERDESQRMKSKAQRHATGIIALLGLCNLKKIMV